MNRPILLFVLLAAAAGLAGFSLAYFIFPEKNSTTIVASTVTQTGTAEKRMGGYMYINPLLECDNYQPTNLNSVVQMQQKVKAYINNVTSSGKVAFVSVYYRDLNFGPWMGINEKEKFSAASLLKVPVMIAVFKKEEAQPGFLSTKVTYTAPAGSVSGLKNGTAYTVQQLMEDMLLNSNDQAKALVEQTLGENFISTVMADIGINTAITNGDVSIKDYSGFFRLLYNATYLDHANSEKALTLLSRVTYKDGLAKGLPEGIALANKQGVRTDGNMKQLHECGIVYYKTGPYLLGVMTRGNNINQLSTVISDLSSLVYSEVSGASAATAPK